MAIRILITDDHGVVRQGLRMFLSLDPEMEVVGEAANGQEALALARELKPDVVLMDLLMPVMDGIEATRAIRSEFPEVEVIALMSVLDDGSVTGAVRAGALGYLLKDTGSEELRRAIKAAAEGRVHLVPEAAARLMREVKAPENPEALTEREVEVLKLLARGRANKQIARLPVPPGSHLPSSWTPRGSRPKKGQTSSTDNVPRNDRSRGASRTS